MLALVVRVVDFSSGGGTKLERFLPKNQHTKRKLSHFENWCNGKVSKIGHHFRKQRAQILRFMNSKFIPERD